MSESFTDSVRRPAVLILSSVHDLATDFVVAQLRHCERAYLRINIQDLPFSSLSLDPTVPVLTGTLGTLSFEVTGGVLSGIWFRRPTFLRESVPSGPSPESALQAAHWATFLRSMMVFDSTRWMNHPAATYRAENKAVQLLAASRVGFALPKTVITNDRAAAASVANTDGRLAVKGLDTLIISQEESETFGYTTQMGTETLDASELSAMPIIAQSSLDSKLDLRVTVIGERVFCAAIRADGKPIPGDWRLRTRERSFSPYELPAMVATRCVQLTSDLGLSFGALDLALQDDQYFFLEINPTGEWAWLVDDVGFPIHEEIARYLVR